ncbi:unnamed protein product [Ectocarpus sp. 8 AP-2014]
MPSTQTQGLLSSVSSHSFSRRTNPGGAKKSSSEVDTKGWFLEKQVSSAAK